MSAKNGEIHTRGQLTKSSALHFFCRDPKDRQHFNNNFNDHVAHSPGRCDAGVYLKPAEEMFNAIKGFDKLVFAIARIFSRLVGSVSK